MDSNEKRILAYGILANIGSIMLVIGLLGALGIINQLAMSIIEIIMAPNLAVIGMYIRYKYKINVDTVGKVKIPKIPKAIPIPEVIPEPPTE